MMNVVPPRRRLPSSLVMNPRCANEVPVKVREPPPHRSPTSVRVMKSIWRWRYSAPFGVPGRARGEDDRDGFVGVGHALVGCCSATRRGSRSRRVLRRGRHRAPRGRRVRRSPAVSTNRGLARSSTPGTLAGREAVVHAGGHRADLRRGKVGEEVLGSGRKDEREHVARAKPAPREPDRDLVGDPVEVLIGDRPAIGGDVGGGRTEPQAGRTGRCREHGGGI